jgi:hypothetical protein
MICVNAPNVENSEVDAILALSHHLVIGGLREGIGHETKPGMALWISNAGPICPMTIYRPQCHNVVDPDTAKALRAALER